MDNDSPGSSMGPPSRPRKRTADHTSSHPSTKRARSGASFTPATKEHAKNDYDRRCAHCTAACHDVTHVFAQVDGNFDDCKALGLINLNSRSDPENALVLCRNCHDNYDKSWKPALIIAPTHLEFFSEVEKNIQASSERKRLPPTSVMYAEYCHMFDPTIKKERGGLYTCYMDTPYLGDYGVQPGRNLVIQWAGDPMAILYRSICASRQIIIPRGFPLKVKDQLRVLNDLYMAGDKKFAANIETAMRVPGPDTGSDDQDGDIGATPRHASSPASPTTPLSNAKHISSANGHINPQVIPGMLSPPPSFAASPDKAHLQKRKLAELEAETEANAKVEREAKRTNLEAHSIAEDVRSCPAAKEFPGFGYIWELFLQSTDIPNPDHDLPDIEKPPVASDTDAPLTPNAYNPIMDDKRFWRWEGRSAEDAIEHWRKVFLPLYMPKRDPEMTMT